MVDAVGSVIIHRTGQRERERVKAARCYFLSVLPAAFAVFISSSQLIKVVSERTNSGEREQQKEHREGHKTAAEETKKKEKKKK